jgi:hypothetical protein
MSRRIYCDQCGGLSESLLQVYANYDSAKACCTTTACGLCYQSIVERNKRDLERVKEALGKLDDVFLPTIRRVVEPLEDFKRHLERDPAHIF